MYIAGYLRSNLKVLAHLVDVDGGTTLPGHGADHSSRYSSGVLKQVKSRITYVSIYDSGPSRIPVSDAAVQHDMVVEEHGHTENRISPFLNRGQISSGQSIHRWASLVCCVCDSVGGQHIWEFDSCHSGYRTPF